MRPWDSVAGTAARDGRPIRDFQLAVDTIASGRRTTTSRYPPAPLAAPREPPTASVAAPRSEGTCGEDRRREGGFIATGAGANFEEDVGAIFRVSRHEWLFQGFLKAIPFCLGFRQGFLGQGP